MAGGSTQDPIAGSTQIGDDVLMIRISTSLALLWVGMLGCVQSVGVAPTDGDHVPALHARAADLQTWDVEGDLLVSPLLHAPTGATRVAAIVRTESIAGRLAIFAKSADDDEWHAVETPWQEETRRVVRYDLAGVATDVQFAIDKDHALLVTGVSIEAVVPMPKQENLVVDAESNQSTQAVLDGYQPRSAWNARAENGCSTDGQTKNRITIHHTVSQLRDGDPAEQRAEIRSAQALHMDGRGYCDLGYHFATTADGTVYEGRRVARLGGHTGGQNGGNLGIVFVGCFHPTSDCDGLGSTTPPQAMIDGAGTFVGIAAEHFGMTLNFGTTFFGHRDNPGQSTACPGDNLHDRLGDIEAIAEGGGTPVTTTGRVQGAVWDLSRSADVAGAGDANAFLPGAVVRTNTGVEATAREGDAYWRLDLEPGTYTLTASIAGFENATRDITIASGDSLWSSLGVTPAAQAVNATITVRDEESQAVIPGAQIVVGGAVQNANVDGVLNIVVPPGTLTITASAEMHDAESITVAAVLGTPLVVDISLARTVVIPDPVEPDPTDPDPTDPDPTEPNPTQPTDPEDDEVARVVIRNQGTPSAAGGCTCNGQPSMAPLWWLSGLVLLRKRRRERA
jgi:hypothetical protein